MSSTTPEPATAAADAGVKVVSLYQPHKKIYAKAVEGRFNNWRWVFVWLTQIIFYGLPWLMGLAGVPQVGGPTVSQACASFLQNTNSTPCKVREGAKNPGILRKTARSPRDFPAK